MLRSCFQSLPLRTSGLFKRALSSEISQPHLHAQGSPRGKVVLLENIHPNAVKIFEDNGFLVDLHTRALSGQELIDVAGDANILGIRSKTNLTEDFFQSVGWHSERLWAVGCFCIGTNQVDLGTAASKGVTVFNAPFSNTRSVAEKVIAETIALQRRLFERSASLHAGVWRKSATGSHEVRGTTLGIVGYGRIGTQVSILAELMGLRVIFYDPVKRLPLGNATQTDTLEELLEMSDVVTLHVPSAESTRNMIGAAQLARMKPGAHLINNARGTVVDLNALAESINSGHLGGAAVDVFPEEPAGNSDDFNTVLRGVRNTILTPHVGGSTEEAQENIASEVSEKLVRFMMEGSTTTAVNVPEVHLATPNPQRLRVLHLHHNKPGVLSQILQVFSELEINVLSQQLNVNDSVGYAALDVEPFFQDEVQRRLLDINETVACRFIPEIEAVHERKQ